jgi:hypothetical protein
MDMARDQPFTYQRRSTVISKMMAMTGRDYTRRPLIKEIAHFEDCIDRCCANTSDIAVQSQEAPHEKSINARRGVTR